MSTKQLLLVAGGAVALGIVLLFGGVIGFALGRYTAPAASTNTPTVGKGTPDDKDKAVGNTDQADRAALAAFVKSHAQDPTGLEIIELKPAISGNDGQYTRNFRIRCKLLDHTPNTVETFVGVGRGGYRTDPVDSKPVSLDTGSADYGKDGKIARVHLDQCAKDWRP